MILLTTILAIGSIASLPRTCAEGSDGSLTVEYHDGSTCGDQYNALVGQAKASLVRGDRSAAISSLIGAKAQLRRCQEMEERNSIAAVAVALNTSPPPCIE